MAARCTMISLLVFFVFAAVLASWSTGCGSSSTPYDESTLTTAANTSTTSPLGTDSLGTVPPATNGTASTGGPSPETTILPDTGTTGSEGQLFALTWG